MIQNKTARKLMYDWHGGQSSAFYAAASSGLVQEWGELLRECETLKDNPDHPEDYRKLVEWINKKRNSQKFSVIVRGVSYSVLPWVSRS